MAERREPARQLPLDLALAPSFAAEDFLVGPTNEEAYSLVERWPDWPDPILRLEGPAGSGKSHLAAIWAGIAHAWRVDAVEVSFSRAPHLVSNGALVIEDCDRGGLDEAALFHLLNLARERRSFVLFTAARPPDSWGIATRDLLSRLRLAPVARLDPPDDGLLKAVLVKLFVDRQLVVDTSVVDTLARHLDRSLAAASEAVAALDTEALAAKRRITRAMARGYLAHRYGVEEGEGENPSP